MEHAQNLAPDWRWEIQVRRTKKMRHSVRAFYKTTERLAFRVETPADNLELLTVLMGWQEPDAPIYEYELSDEQIPSLEALTGKPFNSPDYLFFGLVVHEKVGIYCQDGRWLSTLMHLAAVHVLWHVDSRENGLMKSQDF